MWQTRITLFETPVRNKDGDNGFSENHPEESTLKKHKPDIRVKANEHDHVQNNEAKRQHRNEKTFDNTEDLNIFSSCEPKYITDIPSGVRNRIQRMTDDQVMHDDPELVRVIKENYIDGPGTSEINLQQPVHQTLQAKATDKLLQSKVSKKVRAMDTPF